VHETMDMRGAVTLRIEDAGGRVIEERRHPNRIVKSGRGLVAKLFGGVATGAPPSKVTHVAVGTGAAVPTDDDAALQAEVARNQIASVVYADFDEPVTGSTEVIKRTRASLTAVFDFGQANATQPLVEAGVFAAASGGVMYNRVTFAPVTKTPAFKLTVLWDIVF